MAFVSIKNVFARAALATPEQFDEWSKLWRAAVDAGSGEPLIAFMAREAGLSEEVFLERLAAALSWPFINLKVLDIPAEARGRISTKVAFQHLVIPTSFVEGVLQVAVCNPFDTALINAVQFDARGPVQFALAPRAEIEKALKKYFGVGAETLDQMAESFFSSPVPKPTLWKWIRTGHLAAIRIGRRYYVKPEDVQMFLLRGTH